MYVISKEFHFSASHQLFNMPDGHPCANLHGHNYIVTVELAGRELNQQGFIVDYLELKPLKEYIDNTLDHKHLNEILGDDGVTAERMANHLYNWCKQHWPQTYAVKVCETPKTMAMYCPVPLHEMQT